MIETTATYLRFLTAEDFTVYGGENEPCMSIMPGNSGGPPGPPVFFTFCEMEEFEAFADKVAIARDRMIAEKTAREDREIEDEERALAIEESKADQS